jgi:hypothetical protein
MSEISYIMRLLLVAVIWFTVGIGIGYDTKCRTAIGWELEAGDE